MTPWGETTRTPSAATREQSFHSCTSPPSLAPINTKKSMRGATRPTIPLRTTTLASLSLSITPFVRAPLPFFVAYFTFIFPSFPPSLLPSPVDFALGWWVVIGAGLCFFLCANVWQCFVCLFVFVLRFL